MLKELPERRVRADGNAFVAGDACEKPITSPEALLHVLKLVQSRRKSIVDADERGVVALAPHPAAQR
jgi:hypothetical protein